jgi:hypothetical protein
MPATRPILKQINYSVRTESGRIELVVERELIDFVEEIIPDGQMAGMKGHREVPCTQELTFELHPAEARHLWEQLGQALAEHDRHAS